MEIMKLATLSTNLLLLQGTSLHEWGAKLCELRGFILGYNSTTNKHLGKNTRLTPDLQHNSHNIQPCNIICALLGDEGGRIPISPGWWRFPLFTFILLALPPMPYSEENSPSLVCSVLCCCSPFHITHRQNSQE